MSDSDNWALNEDFDIVADCFGDPNPNCVECNLSLNDFITNYGFELTDEEIDIILTGVNSNVCGTDEFDKEAANILLELINQNEYFGSPSLQDFQGDQEGTYLAQLQKAVDALRAAGVDWYADFIQELIDCEEFETIGDLHDTWYMVKDLYLNIINF